MKIKKLEYFIIKVENFNPYLPLNEQKIITVSCKKDFRIAMRKFEKIDLKKGNWMTEKEQNIGVGYK